jgi:hypothetical protein
MRWSTACSLQAPFAENTAFTLELPKDFKDASGRALRNADSFPLKVATGGHAAAGQVCRVAVWHRRAVCRRPDGVALLPVTLRNVEAALGVQGLQAGAPAPPMPSR